MVKKDADIGESLMDKVIVLFGAGANGRKIQRFVSEKYPDKIVFCDNDIGKQNSVINGINVISFAKMLKLYEDGMIDKIILTVVSESELLYQCIVNKVDIKYLYFWDNRNGMIRPINERYMNQIYSQDGEEVYLKELFRGMENKGVYVDVGANHPFRFSNTYWAYLRGWRGINIEPDKNNYELLKAVKKEDININCGISDAEMEMEYYVFRENALNTFCKQDINNMSDVIEIRKIPVRRLDSILDEYNVYDIDFIDIDVEGMEISVLHSIDWDKVQIRCILVEQRGMTLYDVVKSEACKFLVEMGYMPMNKYNRTVIYVRVA